MLRADPPRSSTLANAVGTLTRVFRLRVDRSSLASILSLVAAVACGGGGADRVVSAPSVPARNAGSPASPSGPEATGVLDACAQEWTLEGAGGDQASVVVVCGTDVRRELLSRSASLGRAVAPALEPARKRVCACAERLAVPPFVDLVVTANPDRGRASVEASDDDDLDSTLGPPFVKCIGTVETTFAPVHTAEACHGAAEATLKYPIRVQLRPEASE